MTKAQLLKAGFVFFLIASIYMFPAFLGKVDVPFDIRDVRMYPWRYHTVDKKIESKVLWEGQFPKEGLIYSSEINEQAFSLLVPPGKTANIGFRLLLSKEAVKKWGELYHSNFYLTFEFKKESNKDLDFGLLIINNLNRSSYQLPYTVTSYAKNNLSETSKWKRGTFDLNNFLNNLKLAGNYGVYEISIACENKNKTNPAKLYLTNLKLIQEDFSKVAKVHNHYNNDLIQIFTPLREYFSRSIKNFRLPFWNNYILTGAEFLAEPQTGFFHPLYFLIYFLFDHFTAHEIITFLCFFLCGLSAFLLASYWGLGFTSSLFAGIVYMFQPSNVTWFSYEHTLMNTCMIPFLILFFEKCLKEKYYLNKYLLLASACSSLILISGHLQRVYYSILFFAFFALFKLLVIFFKNRKIFFRTIFTGFFILVIGILVGAVVIIPFYPLYLNSHRYAIPDELVTKTSFPGEAFWGLIYPYYKGIPEWPLSGVVNRDPTFMQYKLGFMRNYIYFGFLPFLFSLISLVLIRANKNVLFLFFIVGFTLFFVSGTKLCFFIRDLLPGFKTLQHHKILMLYSVCVPFLAAYGFEKINDFLEKFKFKNFIIIFAFLISIVDLIYYSSYFVTWSDRKNYKPIYKDSALQFIKNKQIESKEPFRVLPFISHLVEGSYVKSDVAEPNTLMPYEIEEISGYSSFIPKDMFYLFHYIQLKDANKLYSGDVFNLFSNVNTPYPISNYHSMILDLLNVKYFIVPNFLTLKSDKVREVFYGDAAVYENKNYLPRAFVVPNYKVIESSKETIVYLDSQEFDPRQEVILMTKPHVIARSEVTKQSRSITIDAVEIALDARQPRNDIQFVTYEPENIKLKVKVNEPGFLVLGHNLNDNWKVRVNDRENKHYQANLVQRAVYLPRAGNYEIEFYYFPKLFLISAFITFFSILSLVCLSLYLKVFSRG